MMCKNQIKNTIRVKLAADKDSLLSLLKDTLKIKFPSKSKALKYLQDNVKNKEDIDKAYNAIPSIIKFFNNSNKKSSIYPPGFIKNLIILIAIVSIFQGTFPAKSEAVKELEKNIAVGFEPMGRIIFDVEKFPKNINLFKKDIIEGIGNKSITYIGNNLPKNLSSSDLLLSTNKYDGFIYDMNLLNDYKGSIYISIKK